VGGGSHEAGSRSGQGRFVDPALGLLSGEASEQRIATEEEAYPSRPDIWRDLPTEGPADPEGPTYYGRPMLKEPVWIWAVPLYFYVGGTAGAAAVLAAAARGVGGEALRPLVVRGRWVAAVGCAVGSGLLITDLGRPERFLHMLRVFRPTSPMSVGSWVLAGTASLAMGSALLGTRRGVLGGLGDAAGYGAALLGLPLAGYTAVLLSNTAVPLWQGARRSLPALFIASGTSGAASVLDLLPLPSRAERVVHRFGLAGKAWEMAGMAAVEREAEAAGKVGAPLREGLAGALWKTARAATAASLLLSLLPRRARRGKLGTAAKVATGLLGTAGAIALRFAIFHAGKASARDPRATFRQQREGHGAAEITPPGVDPTALSPHLGSA
jgi:formate-dependent nitrite reductase membrane component NrfD